jgi:hypothetical protein
MVNPGGYLFGVMTVVCTVASLVMGAAVVNMNNARLRNRRDR